MKKVFIYSLLLFIFFRLSSFGNPQYTNPVLVPSNYQLNSAADPFVFKDDDGTYYCYVTGQGFPVLYSKDLVNWKYGGRAMPKARCKWATQSFWAPEVVKIDDTYYLHYTAAREDDIKRIGMATSKSPMGPFDDLSDEPFFIQAEDKGCIDSHIFFDDDGKVYMYYSNALATNNYIPGTNKRRSEVWVVEVAADLTKTIGEPLMLIYPEQSWEFDPNARDNWNEGAVVLKHNGLYYLMYSANCYCSTNYAVGYATSESPLGPFVKYSENPVLSNAGMKSQVSGPGHHAVVMSPDGKEMICVYHSHIDIVAQGGERMVNIDRMGFREDGTIYIDGPTVTPQDYPSNTNTGIDDVNKPNTGLEIILSPDNKYVHIEIPESSKQITIYNANGGICYTSFLAGNKKTMDISVAGFNAGMYIVRIETINMGYITDKFIRK